MLNFILQKLISLPIRVSRWARHHIVHWLLSDLHIREQKFGTHSVSLGDLITMDSQTPTAAGQIGMNASTGRLLLFIGAASRYALTDYDLAPNGDTTAGKVIQANDSRLTGSGGTLGAAAAVSAYGNASDGDVTFDTSGATPTGWSKSGSTYTRTGIDCQYKTVTFAQDNIILDCAGAAFACRSYNPTGQSGIGVVNAGIAASGSTGGAGASPAAIATSSTGATFYGGSNGGNGGNNSNGTAGTSIPAGGGYGGGQGGRGGSARLTNVAAIRTGGNGGGGTATAGKSWYYGNFWSQIAGGLRAWRNGTSLLQVAGATGGGGGGGRIAALFGSITGSNLPAFQAPGGSGGNGAVAGTGYYAEGGSGGNGGFIEVYIGTNNVGGTPASDVSGGTAGTSAGTIGGTGYVAPTAGTAGTFIYGVGA